MFSLFLVTFNNAFSQNVGINSSGNAPHASAGLDVNFTDKGLLIPNIALTSSSDITTIPSPATSLLVYNTANVSDVTEGYYYFNGSAWVRLATGLGGSSQWTPSSSSIYYNTGKVGIGVTSPLNTLHVYGVNPLFLGGVQLGSASDSILTITNGVVKKLPQSALASTWTTNSSNVYYNTGNVGIGVSSPTYKLQIGAASNPLFMSGVQDGSATDSVLTITGGVVKKLPQSALVTNGWGLGGNSLTSSNFIGSTNSIDLQFKTNNTLRAYVYNTNGSFGVGSAIDTANVKFKVDAGTSSSEAIRAVGVKGNVNYWMQLNVQNMSNGIKASSDIVATNNAENYINMGINSSGNTSNKWGQANDGYLFNSNGDLLLGSKASSGSIYFLTGGESDSFGTGGNGRMLINSAGVAIGTASQNFNSTVTIRSKNTGIVNPLALVNLQAGAATDTLLVVNTHVVKKVANPGWIQGGNGLSSIANFGTTSNYALPFITNNTEKMRLTTSGTLLINTTTANDTYKLYVSGDAYVTGVLTHSSDSRLKKNILPLKYGLNSILDLAPVSYNWIDTSKSTKTQLGLIAQDVKKVIPEVVVGDENKEKLGINYTELIPVLINAVKEQQAKIEAQQKEIDELKALIKK